MNSRANSFAKRNWLALFGWAIALWLYYRFETGQEAINPIIFGMGFYCFHTFLKLIQSRADIHAWSSQALIICCMSGLLLAYWNHQSDKRLSGLREEITRACYFSDRGDAEGADFVCQRIEDEWALIFRDDFSE